ncbi:hypothetical protein [Streptomyces sp. DHE17-7]|uniref:hypothetical protein n=1 Tax=Streptomyces sp. DHE17-7 TaxID=2759949 RepID=UPI000EED3F51|nr:hypothetical protein [Streptomyces sp. DHE17-7]MBJ6623522.1 hypothetical protein [Streptomyces sp. DHE17-7]RIH58490.1 hypothetical protein D3C59_34870 [Streptomyces sp. SHP22-7]
MTNQPTAWDRLHDLIDTAKAEAANTTPSTAIADAIRESVVNAPSLRNCLYPGCLREFDMAARMNGREPARPSWSGDGWHQVTRGPSTGSLCPDHTNIVTQHLPRTVDLPNGRWMVACACDWMSRPQAYGGLLRPLWEEHLLLAAGALTAPVTLAETPGRIPLADHTENSLTELYDALEDTEHDREETREAAQAMYKSWNWHRHALGGAARAVVSVCNMMRTAASHYERDWTADRHDAYLWGVLIGWDDDILEELAVKHRWNEHRVKYVREMRALLAPVADPQQGQGDA